MSCAAEAMRRKKGSGHAARWTALALPLEKRADFFIPVFSGLSDTTIVTHKKER